MGMPGLLLAGLAMLCGALPCAARVPGLLPYVPDARRQLEGGRKVLLVMETDALAASTRFDQTRFTVTGDPYIELQKYQSTAAYSRELIEAQRFMDPLRSEIFEFDFEKRLGARLQSIVSASPWLGARQFEITHGYRAATVERVLNESDTRQMLLLRVGYGMNYDFSELKVSMRASMLLRQIPRGEKSDARLKEDYMPYQLTIESWVRLPDAARDDRKSNRDRWAAEHGRLTRTALQSELDWIAARFEQTLAQDEAQSAAWRNRNGRPGRLPNGRPGWILEQGPAGTVNYYSRARTLSYELAAP